MNEITISSVDLLAFLAATAVSFSLGIIYKLRRNVLRQRRAVELGERDIKALADRCDRQQISMTRLDQEVTDMRQAMLQQALSLMPMRSAMCAPVTEVATAQVQTRVAPPATAAPRREIRHARPAASTTSKPPVYCAKTVKPKPALSSVASPKPALQPATISPIQLARKGAKADDLMSRCGLSRAEADLVLSVHGTAAG